MTPLNGNALHQLVISFDASCSNILDALSLPTKWVHIVCLINSIRTLFVPLSACSIHFVFAQKHCHCLCYHVRYVNNGVPSILANERPSQVYFFFFSVSSMQPSWTSNIEHMTFSGLHSLLMFGSFIIRDRKNSREERPRCLPIGDRVTSEYVCL